MREELIAAVLSNQESFGIALEPDRLERIIDYHELIAEHNALLHLVAPMSPAEFAVRHILESLALLPHLPTGSRFADIGSGGGLPAIPCLIARPDLSGHLIESKGKKADFLRIVAETCLRKGQATIVNTQFSEVEKPKDAAFVTCRALDKFAQKVPQIVKWAGQSKLLLFGGPSIRESLTRSKLSFSEELMPLSEQRYLFTVNGR